MTSKEEMFKKEFDMTIEKFNSKLYDRCPDLKLIKDNPNNFRIINTYNNKILKKNERELFDFLEEMITPKVRKYLKERAMAIINNLVDIETLDRDLYYTSDYKKYLEKGDGNNDNK